MAFTFNLATDVGRVRLLIPDRVSTDPIFGDDEIETFLSLEGDDVRRATALALETAASDQTLTLKVVKLLDITTDGAKVGDALLKRAALLRSQAAQAEQAALAEQADAGELFDVAEMVPNSFAWRERVWNEALRNG